MSRLGGDGCVTGGCRRRLSVGLQLIDTDLPRTFPSLKLFGPGEPLNGQVNSGDELSSCNRSEVT